jgi:hypothetical protein
MHVSLIKEFANYTGASLKLKGSKKQHAGSFREVSLSPTATRADFCNLVFDVAEIAGIEPGSVHGPPMQVSWYGRYVQALSTVMHAHKYAAEAQ